MYPSTLRITHRDAVRVLVFGVALSMSPLLSVSTPVVADSPAVAVTGLSLGSRGDAVKSVQQALVNQGLTVAGGVDGVFGPGTQSALKKFQSVHGLAATGVVDDASALALGLTSSPVLGLTQGNRGDAVKALQQALVDRGIAVAGGVDGVFGRGTTAGVKEFQTSRGFAPTGVVNAATAAALGVSPTASTTGATTSGSTSATAADERPDQSTADSKFLGLKIGARGQAVKEMQQLLLGAGFKVVGGADGMFGVLTANALSSFQNARGLKANAVVDSKTAAALESEAAKKAPSTETGTSSASPLAGLRYGSLGSDVTQLQRLLIDRGIRVRGGADGVFGTATLAALKQFQADQGLPQSGTVDDATADALASSNGVNGVAAANPILGLKAGSLGGSVKGLQQALIDAGIKVRGGADGIFGPATANALKEFQRSQGLDASGVVDSATVAALAAPQAPKAPVAPSGNGGFASYGEKGARVVALQTALVKAGVSVRGGVDGSFGGGTSSAIIEFQRRQGLSVTGKINDATAAALGLTRAAAPEPPDVSTVELEVFPVQGSCYYGDSWGYPRGGGRVHLGVDIIAPKDKLLYATVDGKITKVYRDYPGSLAGNGLRLTMADGTYFFYAHMNAVADGIEVGIPVRAGQIIGYVGSTGNSGTSHLHFEVHPKGGAAVNPYPLVKAIDGCRTTEPLPQP